MSTSHFYALVATVWIAPMMPAIAQYLFAVLFFALAVKERNA